MTTTTDDIELLATPMQFEAGDALPEEYRTLLTKLFYHHAEVLTPSLAYETFVRHLVDVGISMAPDPEAKVRLANFYAEEIRHGYLFAKLYSELDPELPEAVLRGSGLLQETDAGNPSANPFVQAIEDWIDLALFNFLIDGEGCFQIREWQTSSYAPLARIAEQVSRDEQGHSNMGYLHLKRAIAKDPAQFSKAQEKLYDKWYPVALDTFGRSNSDRNLQYRRWSLKQSSNEDLRQQFVAYVNPMIAKLGLEVPPDGHNRSFL